MSRISCLPRSADSAVSVLSTVSDSSLECWQPCMLLCDWQHCWCQHDGTLAQAEQRQSLRHIRDILEAQAVNCSRGESHLNAICRHLTKCMLGSKSPGAYLDLYGPTWAANLAQLVGRGIVNHSRAVLSCTLRWPCNNALLVQGPLQAIVAVERLAVTLGLCICHDGTQTMLGARQVFCKHDTGTATATVDTGRATQLTLLTLAQQLLTLAHRHRLSLKHMVGMCL